jgi:hypothetical protein
MIYQNISDMYAADEKVRHKLKALVEGLPDDLTGVVTEGEKWTVAQIVEHISMVNESIGKICGRLLSKSQADGKPSDGTARISSGFVEKATASAETKLEAPDSVQPTIGRGISESLAIMDGNNEIFGGLRSLFEGVDDTGNKLQHPYFGEMTATEWFAVKIAHEARHTRQIAALIEKINS